MDACRSDTFLSQIAERSRRQCAQLLTVLKNAGDKARASDIVEAAVANRLCCPRCQSRILYRHGQANRMQRYQCRTCGRTFNALTGTPLARLRHKSKWLDYLDCMLDSHTVRKAAARLDVAKNTSMRWRHRFLAVTKDDRPAILTGIAEAAETFLVESKKGARKMDRPARKHGGKASKRGLSGAQVCILVARDHSRFHQWLRAFHGVATRYLPNYLGWRWAIDQERIRSPETLLKAATGVFHSEVSTRNFMCGDEAKLACTNPPKTVMPA